LTNRNDVQPALRQRIGLVYASETFKLCTVSRACQLLLLLLLLLLLFTPYSVIALCCLSPQLAQLLLLSKEITTMHVLSYMPYSGVDCWRLQRHSHVHKQHPGDVQAVCWRLR
jgi:hypothetical protein